MTVAFRAVDVRITPVKIGTVSTRSTSSSFLAQALPEKLVTLFIKGTIWFAITRFASHSAGNLPVIGSTLVAFNSEDVRQTWTLTRLSIARIQSHSSVGSQFVANAFDTILQACIAIVTELAAIAEKSFRVVQTFQTFACLCITAIRNAVINVIAALTLCTRTTYLQRVAVVIFLALIASQTSVTRMAIAHDVFSARIQLAAVGMLHSAVGTARTHALFATNLRTRSRISIETFRTSLAVVATRVVATRQTEACVVVTLLSTPVALALATARKVIETFLALVALAPKHVRIARTIARLRIAHVRPINGADGIAITRMTSVRSKAIGSWHAHVAATAHDVRLAVALSSQRLTNVAVRTRFVARALQRPVVDCRSDAKGELLAYFGQLN